MSGCRLFAPALIVDEARRRSGDVIPGGFACLFTGGEALTISRHNLEGMNNAKQEAIIGQRESRAEGALLETKCDRWREGQQQARARAEAGETLGGRVTGPQQLSAGRITRTSQHRAQTKEK